MWLWQPDPGTGYSVYGAYQLMTSQDTVILGAAEDLVWHKQAPQKVSIFVWHLLRDRLPTKTNLVARGIISPEVHFCVFGCGGIESAQHLFLSCSTFGSLLPFFRSWIGFSAVGAHCSRPFCSVHFFSWGSTSSAIIFAAYLACLRLGHVERNKPSLV
jgi:hypothetical protein